MPAETPIKGMGHMEARRSLLAAVAEFEKMKEALPNNIDEATELDEATVVQLSDKLIIKNHNIVLLIGQIVQTSPAESPLHMIDL